MVYQAVRLWWLGNRNLPWLSDVKKKSKKKYRSLLVKLIGLVRLEHLSYGFWMTYVKNWNTFGDAERSLNWMFKSAFQYLSAPKTYQSLIFKPARHRLGYTYSDGYGTDSHLSTQTVNWCTPDLTLLTLNGSLKQYCSHIFMVHGHLFVIVIKPYVLPPLPGSFEVNEPSCFIGLKFLHCGDLVINGGNNDLLGNDPFVDDREFTTTHFVNVDFEVYLVHPLDEKQQSETLEVDEIFGYQREDDAGHRFRNLDECGEANFMKMSWRSFISPSMNEWLHPDGYVKLVMQITVNEKVDWSNN
jgi:hypothetical protein